MEDNTVNMETQENVEVESQQDTTTQTEGASQTNNKAEAPKYTDADVDQIINKKFAKMKAELEQAEVKKAKAVKEAEKLATLTAEEKRQYELDKKQEEYEAMKAKLAELEQQNNYNAMSKQATSMLAEEKIIANDDVLSMVVVADDAERTQANIKAFSKLIKDGIAAGVKEALKGDPLKASRQSEPSNEFTKHLKKYE